MIRKTEFKYLIRKTEFNEYLICKTEFIRNRYRNDNEPILNYIDKFKNHPSIKVIKSRKKEEQTFTFSYVSYEEVLNEIMKLQTTKTRQQNDIPTKF